MAAHQKQVQQLARQLFAMSLADGSLSAERVAGVLEYVEKNPPAQPMAVLLAYRRLVAVEFARGRAVVEHAGPLGQGVLASIESAMARRYGRPIVAVSKDAPGLLAGVRVRVGDDVYESSVANQLSGLSV